MNKKILFLDNVYLLENNVDNFIYLDMDLLI